MYPYGPLHMAKQKQGDQLEPTYSSSERIWVVALRTCRKRCTIERGDEKGSWISVLAARQDDDVCKLEVLMLNTNTLIYITVQTNKLWLV